MAAQKIKPWILPLIVLSQFFCSSLWFSGNAIVLDLISTYNLHENILGIFTSAVQFGFIIGTLVFAVFNLSDRYNPSYIFCCCAIGGALFNFGILYKFNTLNTLLGIRFFTGFFLAGIYPVGMKIASDYFKKGLGKSLSFLVGALVLGKALPHLLKSLNTTFEWTSVVAGTSILAGFGGWLILFFVPQGPHQKLAAAFELAKFRKVFETSKFRVAAFGYFGHMWELYAFWTFIPVLLAMYASRHEIDLKLSFLSFSIIGIGALACVLGGYLSQKNGVKRTARWSLTLSFLCCLLCPFVFMIESTPIFITFLLIWGMVVIADSPLFSTLVASNVDKTSKGTALTIVNCIGFSITIISIQLLSYLLAKFNSEFMFMVLAIGPFIGLLNLRRTKYITPPQNQNRCPEKAPTSR